MAVLVIRGNLAKGYLMLWLPWMIFILTTGMFSDYQNSVQRSLILISPILVGAAASSFTYTTLDIKVLYKLILSSAFILIGILGFRVFVFRSVEITRLAAEAITAVALTWILFTFAKIKGDRFAQSVAFILLLVPLFATTRGALVAGVFAISFSLPFMGVRRFFKQTLLIIGIFGITLIAYPPIAEKMVYEGFSITDSLDSPELIRTSGRLAAWELMLEKIHLNPMLGHGTNSSEEFLLTRYSDAFSHPHNDYLRILFDYGLIGFVIFFGTIAIQLSRLVGKARELKSSEFKFVAYSAASLFIPFLLIMGVDNVVLYAAFFGNWHFLLVGIVESGKHQERRCVGGEVTAGASAAHA
jgi:O-antigen ligase